MAIANKGTITTENGLTQLSDNKSVRLTWTKTVGTAGKSCQDDAFTATGTSSDAFAWAYTAEPLPENPRLLKVNVVKTAL